MPVRVPMPSLSLKALLHFNVLSPSTAPLGTKEYRVA